MDRKFRGTCAGVVTSLGLVLSVGCGADSIPSSTSAQDASPSAQAEVLSSEPVVVEVASEPTPATPPATETPADAPAEAVVVEPTAVDPYANDEWPAAAEVTSVTPEEASVAADAQQPAPAVADVESEAAEAAPQEKQPGAETELRFAGPSDTSAQQPGAKSAPGSEPALIKLAIRPRDIETLEEPEPEAVAESEPGRAAKSELTPIQVMPIPVPEAVAKQAPPAAPPADVAEAQPPVTAEIKPQPQAEVEKQLEPQSPQTAQVQPSIPQAQPQAQPLEPEPQAPPQLAPARKPRSPAMIATLARADERARHGIQLAQKGALYAARREFTTAIKLIAQANDVDNGNRDCVKAAIAGFTAMKEANDLLSPAAAMGEIEVAALVGGHKTPVLKGEELSDMPATVAAGYYYNYAKDQLADAIGRQTVGSIALYGLGKIIVAGAGSSANQLEYTGPAMALYQAALLCEPHNYRAAHELGVLYAGAGQFEAARELLIASATKAPQPVIWRNLATVHSRMGERQLAVQAQQRAEALAHTQQDPKTPNVTWVDPATFATTSMPGAQPPVPSPAAAAGAKQNNPSTPPATTGPSKPAANVAGKKSYEWNPLNLRR
jgi:tetratricopeptide (TPR) repeat protein